MEYAPTSSRESGGSIPFYRLQLWSSKMGLTTKNPCGEILLPGSWQECVLVFYREIADYDIMIKMIKLGKIPPAAKLIALELMK